MLEKCNGVVDVGSSVQYQDTDFEVTELEENRIKTVMITFK